VTGALYWILVNSVLEEYVWRWFCVKQCEQLFSKRTAIVCSALFFTLHHIVAMASFFGPTVVSVCALGVFVGGAVWSTLYVKYRSIWPGYVSHAIVDLCIFGIGAAILFEKR
jgi:membrane protease YdiL (CAAX protease family)